ncbi:MAG: hypothetical protein ACPLW9_01950 [Minisyncoccales bacterium]
MAKQIAIILVIVLIIAAVFIFLWTTKVSQPSEETTQPAGQGPSLKKETPGVVDCGTFNSKKPKEEQDQIKTCWEEKFKTCQPAKMVSIVDSGSGSEPIEYYSEIIGPGEGEHVCQVKSKFLNNPKTEWVNKEMICNYDNSLSFDFASQNMLERCSGPLIDLIKGK